LVVERGQEKEWSWEVGMEAEWERERLWRLWERVGEWVE
jgi:hypothetical protein